ncbi:MAG: alcohol dehydrogenase catalytic domain-containing protein [Actinomycetota bacterium]
MKAVIYEDVKTLRVGDVDDARIEDPGDAVIRVTTAAICGSDLHFYHGKAPLSPGETIGHEGMGVVTEVGSEVTKFKPGDRVVMAFDPVCGECWFCLKGQTALCSSFRNLGAGMFGGGLGGTQAEYTRVPTADFNLLAVPEGLDDEQAVFLGDILTTGVYGAGIAGIQPGDTVAIIGAGPVGFFAAQAAKMHDPEQVLVLDMQADRLALADKVGTTPINVSERNAASAVDELTDGRGADVVIECVGNLSAFESAVGVVRRGGIICIVGMYMTESYELQMGISWGRGLTYRFSGIAPVHAWWERGLQAVRDGTIDPLPIISHTLPLDEAVEGYRMFDAREATKVLLKP